LNLPVLTQDNRVNEKRDSRANGKIKGKRRVDRIMGVELGLKIVRDSEKAKKAGNGWVFRGPDI
jgi:hypothetical protein